MRVALVHYWLVNMRGGEKVLEALCRLFPEADIFTHVSVPEALSPTLKRHRIHHTCIKKLPLSRRFYRHYLPLMPYALEQLDLRGYDLVISSESGPAKGVITHSGTPHICYCHTPMRYLWDFYHEYLEEAGPVSRFFMRPVFHRLRQWDTLSANRVDWFAANSAYVARRIARWYRREAEVIHPPVDLGRFRPPAERAPGDYYLCLSQLVGYKKVELAVQACTRMGRKLLVVGSGPEEKRLKSMAGPSVTFAGRMDPASTVEKVQGCRALLFPGEEDFGIVPVEAMAAGRPVLAFGRGGALETVEDGRTGLFFPEQTVASMQECLERFEGLENQFNPAEIMARSELFSEKAFAGSFIALVNRATGLSLTVQH